MAEVPTVSAISRQILDKFRQFRNLTIGIGDLVIKVKTNSAALEEELRTYFREFISIAQENILIHAIEGEELSLPLEFEIKDPDPGKTRIKEEFADLPDGRIVRKRLTGVTFIFNGTINLAVGPCVANSNQVVNFINNRFIERKLRTGGLLAHASAICLGERGMAMAGFSGSGKSTLALHAMSLGASFVSNDRLIISGDAGVGVGMFGIPKHPRVNPGTLLSREEFRDIMDEEEQEYYSHLSPEDLWAAEHKFDLIIDHVFGKNKFQLSSPMQGLLLLNWKRNGAPPAIGRIDITERLDLLSAFIKAPGLFFMPETGSRRPDFKPERYISLLKRCDIFEADGGIDFDRAADFCLQYLKDGGDGR